MPSTCSWENVSKAAWATRALATSCCTSLGLVELDRLRPPATASSAVGLTMVAVPPYRRRRRRAPAALEAVLAHGAPSPPTPLEGGQKALDELAGAGSEPRPVRH